MRRPFDKIIAARNIRSQYAPNARAKNQGMNAYLFPALEMTPRLLAKALNRVEPSEQDTPTHPGRFTPREVACHMTDWEPILLDRMRQCVESPGSTLVPYDEGRMAVDNNYAGRDMREEATNFQAERAKTVAWLQTLGTEDWSKSAVHPERGMLTVYDIANMLVCHDVYHLEQLSMK